MRLLFVVVNEAEGLERLGVAVIQIGFPRKLFGSITNTIPGLARALRGVGGKRFQLRVHVP